MPADFNKCVASGGRVRTKTLSNGRYMHLCFKDGKSYSGEVKTKSHKEAVNHVKKYLKNRGK